MIVREIVEAHGGTVGVRSSPGSGSSFWFRLPRAEEAAGATPSGSSAVAIH
jgi:two-component system phosphate regulon sensor histidine kinase PhoR